jgi:hypothetical protein
MSTPAVDCPVVFPVSSERDPDGAHLRDFLTAYLAWERMRVIRGDLVSLLAVSSAGVWIAAVEPQLLPGEGRFFVEALWAMFFLATVLVAAVERIQLRRWRSLSRVEQSAAAATPLRGV